MPLVSTSIPNLINGISQQPAEIRMPTQAERQVNGLSSVARGLEKRPGTEHRARVSTIDEDDLFIHSIRRDRDEEYTMILSRTAGTDVVLTNCTLVNNDATVLVSSTSNLAAGMLVSGTGITTGTTVLSVTDATHFELSAVATTDSSTITLTITNVKTLKAYDKNGNPVKVLDAPTTNATTATNEVDNADLGYLEVTEAGGVKSNIVATTVADTTFIINKTVVVEKADAVGEASGEGEVDSSGDPVSWSSSIGFTSRAGSVDLDTTYPHEGIIYVKNGDYSSKYVVAISFDSAPTTFYKTGFQTPSSNAGVNQAYTATTRIAKIIKTGRDAIGGNADNAGTDSGHGWDDFDSTAPVEGFGGWRPTASRDESGKTSGQAGYEGNTYFEDLDALVADSSTGGNLAVSMDASSSVIKVKCKVPFSIKCSDSSGGEDLVGFTKSVRSFTELPGVGVPDKYIVEIVGNADATQDNFFVQYNKTDKTWNECIGPSQTTGLNIFTMPHRLIRLFDTTTAKNIYFLYEPVKEIVSGTASPRYGWSSRKSGEDLSNPFPTFVGGKINDICFHKNRFGILSDENIIFSNAGNYYNFFPISVMTALATNPIDISVSNNEVSILKHAAAFDQSLLLFSDFQQFSLNSEGSAFSPSSVSVDVVTQFESTSQAPPISSGKFVYFPFKRGEFSGVREYFVDTGSADSNDATDITAHVPQYIKGNITKMVVSSTDQIIAVLSDDDPKRVYIYKQFWSDQKKLQNSWSHWTFDGDILNCAFLGSTLQLIVKRLKSDDSIDGIYLEDLNLSLDSAEAVMEDDTAVLLDRRVKLTYNQTVAADLPYYADIPSNIVYVDDNARKIGSIADVNEYLSDSDNQDNVVYAGIPFTFEYEFSKFIHKENELPVQTAKLQVRNIHLLYSKTGFFNVKVNVTPGTIKIPDGAGGTTTVTPRTNYSKNFSGMLTNTSSFGEYKLLSGTFKSSVMTNSANCNIILENNEYLPCAFMSAEWEGFLHKRNQRV